MKKVVLIFLELSFVILGILKSDFTIRLLNLMLQYALMLCLLIWGSIFPPHLPARKGKALVGKNTTASHSVCDRLVRPLLVGIYWSVHVFVIFFLPGIFSSFF